MKRTHMVKVGWPLVLLLVFGLVWPCAAGNMTAKERAELEQELKLLNKQSRAFTESFNKVIELAMPAVVSLSTTRTVKRPALRFPVNPDDLFRFPDPFRERGQPRDERSPAPREREYKQQGLGSGFVVDAKNGYIVTNYHVVKGVKAEDIKITFYDGKQAVAEKVVHDEKTEVAVVKVKPDNLVALKWADPKDTRVGQWAIAIGSPMGFGNTVTAGIVSATSTRNRRFLGEYRGDLRVIDNPYAIEDYIQTDAAINRGNSGGPLINLLGRVMGMNTLIVTPSGASAGLGFAVPTSIARPVVEALTTKGHVVRGHLGVRITDPAHLSDDAAWKFFEMHTAKDALDAYHIKKNEKGVLVIEPLPDSPAEKAKIQPGDLIVAMNDTATPDSETLRRIIANTNPGSKIQLKVRRKGREMNIPVTLGEQPSGEEAIVAAIGKSHTSADLGLTVQTLTADMRKGLGYDEDIQGVIITDVARGSPADRAGLKRNDLIMQVRLRDVKNVEDFQQLTRNVGRDGMTFLVKSGNQPPQFRTVKP